MKYALAVLLFVCGCGGEDGHMSGTVDEFCWDIAGAYCDDEAQCTHEPVCYIRQEMHAQCMYRYACLSGAVEYTQECLDAIVAGYACDAPFEYPPECPEVCP